MVKRSQTDVKNEIVFITFFDGTIRDVNKSIKKFEKNLSSKFEITEPFGQVNQNYFGRIAMNFCGIYYDIKIHCNGSFKPKALNIYVTYSQHLLQLYESAVKSELKDIEEIIGETFEKPAKSTA